MKKVQKIVSFLSIFLLLAGQFAPAVRALEPPSAPTPPPAPTYDEPAPTPPPAPTYDEPAPTPPEAPTYEESTTESPPEENSPTEEQPTETVTTETQQTSEQPVDGNNQGGNVGDTEINTGDATTTATGVTEANNNSTSVAGTQCCESEGISIVNTGNGTDSTNTGSVQLADASNTFQNNSATVVSDLGGSSNTGDNNSSDNVGNTTIETGDANTSGTLITAVNTNVDGIMVSEFNVVDDHVGDLILDFGAGCVTGCGGDTSILNSGNGSNSTNTGTADIINADNTFQTNDATVLNGMVLDANSGNNTGDKNTGGDTAITTGDANINANLLTFANNNISGDVIYSVVNIYGDLLGDIIFPESEFTNCCGTSATLTNSGNGSDSTNTTEANITDTDTTNQYNTAVIDNILTVDATTGDNSTSKNTGGDNSITTGDSNIDAQLLNVANTNIDGGNWWLVLVNEAGNWIGHILGTDGNYAGSVGSEFTVNEATGEITVTNSGNGSGSTNTGSVNQNTSDTTTQVNTAHVVNNVTLDANTGGNSASKNTGGNSTIETGDANVIANIVNFVNNNIIGGGKLFVTVVNVFGSWTGNFLPPGFQKPEALAVVDPEPETEPELAIGGANVPNPTTTQDETRTAQQLATQETQEPTPTPTKAPKLTFAGGTFGSVRILGTTTAQEKESPVTQGSRIIRLNLAWLLLLIPSAILFFVLRRMRRTASAH